jgi:glycosyltransferase involved in cell wall biosynthesis
LKILQVYRTYFPDTQGGGEEVIRQIAKGIRNSGAECKILVPSKNAKEIDVIVVDGIEVIRFPEVIELASCNMFIRGFSKYRELVAWADIVHYHFPWPFQDIMHASLPKKLRSQKKFIATYHADIVKQKFLLKLYSPLMHWFLGQMDHLVASSANYSQSSLILRPYLDKVKVIPFGLDESTLPVLNQGNKAEWKSKVGEGFFFFVGVLRYYKGLHILLEAARDQKFKVVIAGAGNMKASLIAMIEQYGLTNVVLVGHVSDEDKVSLLGLSKGVVMPSFLRSEAFGIALLEGLSAGKPLVTADINSGMSFVNKHEETGLWVEPESSISLRGALNQLNEDAGLCEELGRNARARFDTEFTHGLMSSRYMSLYQSLLGD